VSDEKGLARWLNKDISDPLLAGRETVNPDTPPIYEFGPFRLERNERKLLRGNEIVELTPKAFDTLLILVRNSGHLLEKGELLGRVWPETFVEEGSLSNNIFLLRKALGEDTAFIETVPRRGYRFVGAVRQLPHAAPSRLEKPFEGHLELANEVSADRSLSPPVVAAIPANGRRLWPTLAASAAVALVLLAIGAALWLRGLSRPPDRSQWVQLTQFSDSVSQPALSPDGRMLAFIRGYEFGQVYVKNTSGWRAGSADARQGIENERDIFTRWLARRLYDTGSAAV
jgi:DNA-binding winged helix-turn-helix (wHTH) protein